MNKKLSEDYPATADVAVSVKQKLEAFREHLPLIKCITSEAISDEDWNEIKLLVDREDLERDTITVMGFSEFKLHDFMV